MPLIPYGRQSIDASDLAAVQAVLQSDWLTQGPAVERFEAALAERVGALHAVAVCNATAALHLAVRVLDLGPGDRLWTSPNTFVASANCARYCGAEVDFVDIDPRTYNLCPQALADKLAVAEARGRLPKVVVAVDFAGQPCELAPLRALADRYGFYLVSDSAHAIGACYRGQQVGSGHAHLTVFSFHPVKIVTTGEGGAVTTDDPALARRLMRLRSHGISRDPGEMIGTPQGPWDYQQLELGYNYRLTDLQAALGSSQLARLDAFLARRRALTARYDAALSQLPVIRPWQHPDGESAWHLYVIQVDPAQRRRVFEGLRAAGIGVNVHYIPVHTQPYYRALGFGPGDFPVAESYYAGAISLPLYADLTESDQDTVIQTLGELLS